MDYESMYENASAAFVALQKIHTEFIQTVSSLDEKQFNAGDIGIDGEELKVTCLGAMLRSTHRPLVREGRLAALEYSFHMDINDERVTIWSMVVEPNGGIYADTNKQNHICSTSNKYLAQRLLPRLAEALLKSAAFAQAA